ncbi:oligosaccharide flippase family protein [Bacteroidota bacterium]
MNFKKYFSILENTVSLFSFKAIDLGMTLWLIPFLIVKVGITNYGHYAFAMAFVLFFVNILNYGFNLCTVREIAKSKGDRDVLNRIFNQVVSVKFFLFIVLALLYVFFVFLIPKFLAQKSLFLFAGILLFGDLFSLRWFFMGMEKMKYITLIHLAGTLIFLLGVVYYVNKPQDYIFIPLLEAIGMLVSTVFAFIWVFYHYKFRIKILSLNEIVSYLKINFSSFVSLVLPSTYSIGVVFLVGLMGVPAHVSLMQIGVKVSAAFTSINTILTSVFFPLVNRKQKVMGKVRLILLAKGVFVSLLMYFLAEVLISKWLGFENQTNLKNAVTVVTILSPIPFLMAVISSYGINGLLTYYKDNQFGWITGVAFATMIVSGLFFIPKQPFLGGALSFLLGRTIYGFLSFVYFKRIK